ncbi:hypothetical protein GCK72_021875 [Caenorhabditis remanei]|uniref:Uncharacterized protein n=1 Tax=Caenorhabditis remanei TaxID=31234 RepID=A0A6A5GL13_CAERE|nr:hypothetical protein GCK72_021875 [Caenorhabditis remanei]KAF1755306.1 hypothetical protein GCK72_021875 [Caenorhabditis remanei]
MILVFLRLSIYEIKQTETWPIRIPSYEVLIWHLTVLWGLMAAYSAFIFSIFFIPVKQYRKCAVLNTIWFFITFLYFTRPVLSDNFATAQSTQRKMMYSLMLHRIATPIALAYSAVLTIFMWQMSRLMTKEEIPYTVIDGKRDSKTKRMVRELF